MAAQLNLRGIDLMCPRCRSPRNQSLHGLALGTEVGRRFWKAHERFHALPVREITVANLPALAVSFEDMTGDMALTVLFARDSYAVLEASVSHC